MAGLAFSAQDHELHAKREFATIQKALNKGEAGFSDTIKAYRKLIRAYPETQVSVRARYEIGELFEKIGEVEKASEAYIVILADHQNRNHKLIHHCKVHKNHLSRHL